MAILKVKDGDTWKEIEAIVGPQGPRGSQGPKGDDGYTPIKGVDYFTPQDIASLDIPTATSDLTNDSGFITNAVDDLVNYYKKSETFTKQEVNNLISAISTLDLQVVQTLPTDDISTTTIYLVPKTTAETNDVYDEYIYVSNAWEHIGSTEVDLTNYITNTDYASSSTAGIIRIGTAVSTYMSSDNRLSATTRTYEDYTSGSDAMFIGKGTLENVITGKGLVSNTDYATSATGGVIKTGASYGTTMASAGTLRAVAKTYEEYSSAGDYMFVGKKTLENVITGKGLIDNTYHDSSKQDTLVSGTNIKTINNQSLLGSGNITISGGGGGSATWGSIGGTLSDQTDLNTALSSKVSNTDYATASVGGVIKVSNGDYGMTVDSGVLKGTVRTLAQYNDMSSKGMVCKGTLENVLDDRIGTIETALGGI